MRTTSTNTTDCRCKNCQALLAKHDRDGLSIRRGDQGFGGAVLSASSSGSGGQCLGQKVERR